jgi:hypothetical protein
VSTSIQPISVHSMRLLSVITTVAAPAVACIKIGGRQVR